jgi:hypothetical protein
MAGTLSRRGDDPPPADGGAPDAFRRRIRGTEYTAASVAKLPKLIKTKKRCCKSGPRCKRCPVVCKRLEKQGLAERVELRVYRITGDVKKKQLAAARAR